MSRAEVALLVHRLSDLADQHARAEDDDHAADAADTLTRALHRKHLLDAQLLLEAVSALRSTHA